jgi:type IV secretion system protein VirB9
MKYALIAAALTLAAAVQADATDLRISTKAYDAQEIVRLDGRAGVQATIAFADEEQIENVAIGDSASWQVTPNKRANLLFVKPLGPTARTNMTVVTDRHMYLFDLAASPTAPPVYVLRFTYPNEPKADKPLTAGMSADEALALANPPKEQPAADPASLNFAWSTKGARKILPSRIYDDGIATYLTWPARTPIPAILTRNAKGEEGAVNYAVRGEVLILDSVPKTILLRAGKDLATLENLHEAAPPPTPAAPAPAASAQAASPELRQPALAAVATARSEER